MTKQRVANEIEKFQDQFHVKLEALDLKPVLAEQNLYGVKSKPPMWSESHPFHWQAAVKDGDKEAMLQLGLIYDRDGENDKALAWYQKAADAGSAYGKERLEFLQGWMRKYSESNSAIK